MGINVAYSITQFRVKYFIIGFVDINMGHTSKSCPEICSKINTFQTRLVNIYVHDSDK